MTESQSTIEIVRTLDTIIGFLERNGFKEKAKWYDRKTSELLGRLLDDAKARRVLSEIRKTLIGMGTLSDLGLPMAVEPERDALVKKLAHLIDDRPRAGL